MLGQNKAVDTSLVYEMWARAFAVGVAADAVQGFKLILPGPCVSTATKSRHHFCPTQCTKSLPSILKMEVITCYPGSFWYRTFSSKPTEANLGAFQGLETTGCRAVPRGANPGPPQDHSDFSLTALSVVTLG